MIDGISLQCVLHMSVSNHGFGIVGRLHHKENGKTFNQRLKKIFWQLFLLVFSLGEHLYAHSWAPLCTFLLCCAFFVSLWVGCLLFSFYFAAGERRTLAFFSVSLFLIRFLLSFLSTPSDSVRLLVWYSTSCTVSHSSFVWRVAKKMWYTPL